MKKNVLAGHMSAAHESALSRFRKLKILPRFLCLLLALLIWLAVYQITDVPDGADAAEVTTGELQ